MPVQLHHFAQVGHHLVAPTIVGNRQDAHVKGFVDFKKALPVARCLFQLVVQVLQFLELELGSLGGYHGGGIAFKQSQQVVDIGQIAVRYLCDVSAAPHFHGHQAFGREHLQCFSQGRAADAVFIGQLQFVNPAARHQFATENSLAQ